ncbi:MAG: alpha/beta hydrolase [Acidobacteria bacterium]|nr:alpha/beta hydrolase [Acidobacteriota bacterium]MYK90409.1 alpha/beta hydrolase [Acidobacteriota bacterium]
MALRFALLLVVFFFVADAGTPAQDGGAFFDSDGVRIHYADRGRGEPVVLLHGFTGSFARHWESPGVIAALTQAGYRVIAMDCRGHGQSGKPTGPGDYGLEMVNDVVRLLDHLDIERAHVAGYSMGGAIVNQLLVQYPDRLLTAALLGSGWEGENLEALASQMSTLADGFENRDASGLIRGVVGSGGDGPTDAEVAALNASLFARNDPDVLAAVARSLPALYEVPGESLRAVALPVLALVGEHDSNLEAVTRMAGVMPGLRVIQIPGASHASSVRPSAEPLVRFLDGSRGR